MFIFRSRPARWVALLVAMTAMLYAGVRFGRVLRDRSKPAVAEASPFPFDPGDAFPIATLADAFDQTARTDSLLANRGAVVLFLDPTCDGCTDMSIKWEHALAEGFIDPTRVFGISRGTTDANAAYRAANRLSFPIYRDIEDAFLVRHGVASYPLEVVVGSSGTVRSVSDDSKAPVDGDEIRAFLSQ